MTVPTDTAGAVASVVVQAPLVDRTHRTHRADQALRVTFGRLVISEWIKFRSVRSNLVTLLSAGVAVVVLGALFASFAGSDQAAAGPAAGTSDPLQLSLSGFSPAQLVIGVLGVLIASSEYATGMIRTTFAAAPIRLQVLGAKTVVVAGASLLVASAAAALAYLAGGLTYAGAQPLPSWDDETVLRSVLGLGLYAAGVAVIGLALGFLLRGTASAVGVLVVGLLLAPGLAGLLPESVRDIAVDVLPSNAGAAFSSPAVSMGALDGTMSASAGLLIFGAWVLGLLALAGIRLVRRDA